MEQGKGSRPVPASHPHSEIPKVKGAEGENERKTKFSEVVHLPRHLRDVYNWSKERARTALSRYGKRKKYALTDQGKASKKRKHTENTSSNKDYHYHCLCPVEG